MFAYCGNNPVNGSDPSGYLTDGQIHDAVLEEISRKSGGRYKYKRYDTLIIYAVAFGLKWFGFCDLYDPNTGETWELKKNTKSTSCRTEVAQRQLDNYLNNGYLASDPDLKLKRPKSSIPAGYFTKYDSDGTKYLINYWDQGGGILRYHYYIIPSMYDLAMATVIAGSFVASINVQHGGKGDLAYNYCDR